MRWSGRHHRCTSMLFHSYADASALPFRFLIVPQPESTNCVGECVGKCAHCSWSRETKSGILLTRLHPTCGERNGAKPFPCSQVRRRICSIIISQEGEKSMSAEENKQVARRFITAFLAGDTAVLEEI